MIADTTEAASTATVMGRLPVLSSARNAIVSGPPTTATAMALMPTRAHTTGGSACVAVTVARPAANSLPVSAPRNSEAKNNPPRKPEPIETAEATDFAKISSAICVAV